jgi:hypothetical protein
MGGTLEMKISKKSAFGRKTAPARPDARPAQGH